VANF